MSNPKWTLFKSSTWSNRYWKKRGALKITFLSGRLVARWRNVLAGKNCTYCKVVKSRYATSIVFCPDLFWSTLNEKLAGHLLVLMKNCETFIVKRYLSAKFQGPLSFERMFNCNWKQKQYILQGREIEVCNIYSILPWPIVINLGWELCRTFISSDKGGGVHWFNLRL